MVTIVLQMYMMYFFFFVHKSFFFKKVSCYLGYILVFCNIYVSFRNSYNVHLLQVFDCFSLFSGRAATNHHGCVSRVTTESLMDPWYRVSQMTLDVISFPCSLLKGSDTHFIIMQI